MMRSISRWLGVMVGAALVLMSTTASAQVIGTFRWQFAPYCNVVTLRVEQKGTLFELVGTDDQCGAPVAAAASGTAHVNPDGTVGLALVVVRPDGLTLASSATLSLATISGAWSDEYANSGTFVFNPPNPAGSSPRRITIRGNYGVNYTAAAGFANGVSAISFGRILATAPSAIAANFIFLGQALTANCPGSSANPRAAPGHLCVYEETANNVAATRCIARLGTGFECGFADRHGAAIFAESIAAGNVTSQGSWAVTIP